MKKSHPIQFIRAFKKLFFKIFLQHTEGSNCEEDDFEAMIQIVNEMMNSSKIGGEDMLINECDDELNAIESEIENKSTVNLVNLPVDYKDIDIIEKNGFSYVCGYFVKKMLLRHKDCTVCQENLIVSSSSCPSNMYLNLRNFADAYSGLTVPSNEFVQYMHILDNMPKFM